MKTLILDNYDSFTFNLYQEVGKLGGNPLVERNDAVTIDDVSRLGITHIIISPGPGNPYTRRDIGISEELIEFAVSRKIPLLGVCLGHQVLGKHFGATVSRAPSVYHGKASTIHTVGESRIFHGLEHTFEAMRYHSLCIESESMPNVLRVTAASDDGVVMAMEHETLPLFGVQFHPESIGTPRGKVIFKNFLSLDQRRALHCQSAYDLMKTLLSEESVEAQREAAFQDLVSRPITADLLTESVRALRESMVPTLCCSDAIDTCGTGGSGLSTINTSTLTAFVVAAAGCRVAKHGNRSASGNCGCFDLLEELGVKINLDPDQERRIFEQLGITFLYARLHHPALRFVASLRKNHGKRTLFNLIGPLCNPAGVSRQMIGTGSDGDAAIIAETLSALGAFGSIVVTGHDGLDEVTITGGTTVRRVSEYGVRTEDFSPESLSLALARPDEIRGGTVKENAMLFLELAQGKGNTAMRNLILLNAAHALLLTPLATTIEEAFRIAQNTLDSGSAHNLFCSYRDLTHQL